MDQGLAWIPFIPQRSLLWERGSVNQEEFLVSVVAGMLAMFLGLVVPRRALAFATVKALLDVG